MNTLNLVPFLLLFLCGAIGVLGVVLFLAAPNIGFRVYILLVIGLPWAAAMALVTSSCLAVLRGYDPYSR